MPAIYGWHFFWNYISRNVVQIDMNALVISGGGSKGAFAGGVAEYLVKECGGEYDLFVGSSTGSLLLSHIALGEIDKIKRVFTSVNQKDIFNISPFRITTDKDGEVDIKINHFNTVRTFLLGRKTFGESKNLRSLIEDTLSVKEFIRLKQQKKEVIVSVSNLTKHRTEFKSNLECGYDDFIDWIWASANYVPFMSLLEKNGYEYADGGFGTHTPIQAAIDHGASSVDVIVLEPKEISREVPPSNNAFSSLFKVFSYMTDQIYHDDLTIGRLKGSAGDIEIRYFHLPYSITEYPLIFDPVQMKDWWKLGFDHAKSVNPFCRFLSK